MKGGAINEHYHNSHADGQADRLQSKPPALKGLPGHQNLVLVELQSTPIPHAIPNQQQKPFESLIF